VVCPIYEKNNPNSSSLDGAEDLHVSLTPSLLYIVASRKRA